MKTREEIFKIHTKGKPLDKDINMEKLAKMTEGKVGSDIEFICRKAAMLAIREYIEKKSKSLKITKNYCLIKYLKL